MSKGIGHDGKRRGGGAWLALAVGLLWGAAIGVTWYFYQNNDTKGGLPTFFGRFHILMVHLPIGLLFIVPLMEIVGWTRWGAKVREGVPFVLWIAVLTAALASFLGYLMMSAEDIAGRWMTLHMWTGLTVGVFAVLALVFKLAKIGPLYALTLLAAIGATAAAGHFGGAMIHSPEYLTEHAPEKIKPLMEVGLKTGTAERGVFDELVDALIKVSGGEVAPATPATSVEGQSDGTVPSGGAGLVVGGDETTAAGDGAKVVAIPDQLAFGAFVQPILDAKCTECHSQEKIKGKLRLDTHAMILAGAEGSDYKTVVPGDPETSELIVRVTLPDDDDDFMPPEGKDKLTEAELEVLKWWIAGGADDMGSVADLKADAKMLATLTAVAEALATGAEPELIVVDGGTEGVWPTLSAEDQQARIDAVGAAAVQGGFSVLPVSAEDDRLRVSAVNASATFGDEQLLALNPVAERVVWLDAGRTQVTDAAMETIGSMVNLERLHLEETAVTDAGMKHLVGLSRLEYLNLYGTEVTSAIFESLAELRSLRKLFLWETKVDPAAAQQFQRQMSLEVNIGRELAAAADVDAAPAPTPPTAAPSAPSAVDAPKEKAVTPALTPASEPKPDSTPTPAPKPESAAPPAAVVPKNDSPKAAVLAPAKPAPKPDAPAAKPEAAPAPAPAPPRKS